MSRGGFGRFAPSPSGVMHFGNLRTAVAAYLFAKSSGREFLVRIEDIDTGRSRPSFAAQSLADLAALGIVSDRRVVYQSQRHQLYQAALEQLVQKGLVYECYCSRADIAAAASAPHGKPGIYPGICRDLSDSEREAKRTALAAQGRQPALRLRAPQGVEYTVKDSLLGPLTGLLHDFVLRRTDGDWAYQLVVVVDDINQGVDQIVRGADLASSAPVQAWLTEILGGYTAAYAHVPLVMNAQGQRLAKRDKSVTRPELNALGWSDQKILLKVLETLGWSAAKTDATALLTLPTEEILNHALTNWRPENLPAEPVIFHP
ncbi:tRNA glutamyl-Q(34) synthetase GluQRS [Mobiluncus curtisii]|uniref:tRNA glutamyl-Q(34) synthetase GluQRS n=1 Tax=Mobiluncus curtisii TaxID=2051 RepID=UPI0009D6C839|nr:tRNA glutamyl-Q(34) synthetase GluQRS [Mobiluncus curtisii]MCV0020557.1 tRNA glutamyl-Q(34) synthetase GluQRS [Mobiluncus curtisii]NMW43985.1 tRNA glutamyl-Q(34) synthetase GluQRS [Mobiluncus curtisii]NMW46698.1 tRNA glutamyl-Q(34) synthetase GluQRS [Mobiluncus curtisii]NMW83696.1 tRNA glutamyl-Q(34) synthetase GluQRS [Mobiluncus curtisii]NMW98939.1 tRNA glutamyl-Q(34) synthetase GluQRS [Mobiluncus curtisii]